jgi:hypothetical protein
MYQNGHKHTETIQTKLGGKNVSFVDVPRWKIDFVKKLVCLIGFHFFSDIVRLRGLIGIEPKQVKKAVSFEFEF